MWAVTSALCVAAVLSLLLGIYDLHNAVMVGTETGIDAAATSALGIRPNAVPQSVMSFAGAFWALGEIGAACVLGLLARIAQASQQHSEMKDRASDVNRGSITRKVAASDVPLYEDMGYELVTRTAKSAVMARRIAEDRESNE